MTVYARVGADALVNTTTVYDQYQSVAARLNDGSLLVVWVDTGANDQIPDCTIRGQRYTGMGEKFGSEIVISTLANYTNTEPAIAVLPNGEYVVTWSFQTGAQASWNDIHGQRFAANGSRIGDEFEVTTTSDNQMQSKVIPLETGGFVVVWEGWAGDPARLRIVSQQFDASGEKVGSEEILNPSGGGNLSGPSVSTHGSGYVISWTDDFQARARFFDENGDPIKDENGDPITSETVLDATAIADDLSVNTLSDGSLIFSWLRQGQEGERSYVAQKYDGQGQKVGAEILINDFSVFGDDTPVIATLQNGTFLAAWARWDGENQISTIVTQLFDQYGQKAGPEHRAYSSSVYIEELALTTKPNGQVFVSWTSHAEEDTDIRSLVLGPAADSINRAPIVSGTTSLPNGAEDNPVVITKAQLLGNASDPDGDLLWIVDLSVTDGGGSLEDNGDGTWTYSPSANQHGVVSFSYGVTDGALTTATTATLSMAARNDAPSDIGLVGGSVDENSKAGMKVGVLSGFDVDGDTLTFSLVSGGDGRYAVEGNKIVVANGSLLDFEQRSSDQIRIRASDSAGSSFEKTFTVTLNDVASETVAGGSSSDVITGGNGTDKLNGGAGNDDVRGGAGNDYLNGGAGKDTLRGDSGKDYFVFDTKLNAKTNVDKIVDFIVKDDTFLIDNLFFKAIGKGTASKPGKLNSDMFVIGTKAKDADDRIIYDNKKGYLYYDADGTGSSKAILFATLSKKLKMAAADFLVI